MNLNFLKFVHDDKWCVSVEQMSLQLRQYVTLILSKTRN